MEKERKSETDSEIGKIKKAMIDFAKQIKRTKKARKIKTIQGKEKQTQEQVKKLKEKEIIIRHGGEISDFGDEEFYGFCNDSEQKKGTKPHLSTYSPKMIFFSR